MSDTSRPLPLVDECEFRRLRWQCRRGMLELDHLLSRFLDIGYADLSETDRQLFVKLLGQQDTQLSDWFMSRAEPPDHELRALVARIVEVARVRSTGSGPSKLA
jgi:antitoxin CptB